MDKDEQIKKLTSAICEQYKWFSGKVMRETIAGLIARRLVELGWKQEEDE